MWPSSIPGVGTNRDIIAVEADGHAFLAPDNGLLAPVVGRAKSYQRPSPLDVAAARTRFGLAVPSATFHGTGHICTDRRRTGGGQDCNCRISGRQRQTSSLRGSTSPTVGTDQVAGVVITIDHFGNLITNIDAALIQRFSHPVVRTGGHSFPLRRTYGDVRPGDYLALVNSFGVVEIARAEQSAADGLGLGRGAPVIVADH